MATPTPSPPRATARRQLIQLLAQRLVREAMAAADTASSEEPSDKQRESSIDDQLREARDLSGA